MIGAISKLSRCVTAPRGLVVLQPQDGSYRLEETWTCRPSNSGRPTHGREDLHRCTIRPLRLKLGCQDWNGAHDDL